MYRQNLPSPKVKPWERAFGQSRREPAVRLATAGPALKFIEER